MSLDTTNKYFTLASDLVHHTSRNIFLTGKAGTGKTTFLKHILETCTKAMAVVAPTGVAAINAGGSTIHSFFQLPFTPFVPGSPGSTDTEFNSAYELIKKLKLNTEKRGILESIELLVIDEISMVRCDLLDSIDTILKHFRSAPHLSFGGVQVLMIGDLHQLPPVVQDQEWSILSRFYSTPYFFSSKVVSEDMPVLISFEKIYRQTDPKFIDVLNAVRNNQLEKHHIEILEILYQPDHKTDDTDPAIILTTHNNIADSINNAALTKLSTPRRSFTAKIEGEFYERAFPAEEQLIIKEGAQVMFIKNDAEKSRRYFNGKIGTVEKIEDDKITVKCKDDDEAIEVKTEKWENIRYHLNNSNKQIEEEVIGSFTQFPLRLAWAITIHKSQGLTFQKVVIDAGAAFSPGQVYVALSRCTSLEGIVLKSKINYNSVRSDPRILQYTSKVSSTIEIESQLQVAKTDHQKKLLTDLFTLSHLHTLCADLKTYLNQEVKHFNLEALVWVDDLLNNINNLQQVSFKFLSQLHGLFLGNQLPTENKEIQQRIMTASKWFFEQLSLIIEQITKCNAVTDSKVAAKDINEKIYALFSTAHEKRFLLECCINGFDGVGWNYKKKNLRIPSFRLRTYAAESNYTNDSLAHPALYRQLKALRDDIVNKTGKPVYLVATGETLTALCNCLPQDLHELGMISGFGKIRLKEFGEKFLDIIRAYSEEHNLSSSMVNKVDKKGRKEKKVVTSKIDTKDLSYKLHKEGKSIEEIAKARDLSVTTIESHLADYIKRGILQVTELISASKLESILKVIAENPGATLTELKSTLGESVSYGNIRMAISHKEFTDLRTATV